jgi:HEAT repeat protein
VKAAKTDPEPTVRQCAVYALRIIGTPEAGAALEAAAADADANVKREAREQLEWYRKEHPGKR